MDFIEPLYTKDTIKAQVHMEMEHANFRQKTLLVAYFNEHFPDRGYFTDPENDNYKKDEAWEAHCRFQKARKLGIDLSSMICLYRRLPLEALVNLFKHEDSQVIASTLEALTCSAWILWDPQREEFVTSQLPLELERQVFNKRYPMPMLCRPQTLVNEQDSAYLTEGKSQSVLGDYSGQRTNLATLNALNQIPFKINQTVKKQAPDTFKNDDKFRRDSNSVFERIQDETFYLTWQFDFRGRVYARGYHVNPQGDDWHKHQIQFGR